MSKKRRGMGQTVVKVCEKRLKHRTHRPTRSTAGRNGKKENGIGENLYECI